MADFQELRFLILKTISGLLSLFLFASSTISSYQLFNLGILALQAGTSYYELTLFLINQPCPYRVFSAFILVTEFSPYLLENYIVLIFPFLASTIGKGCFYLIICSFQFDPELQDVSKITGYMLAFAGIGWIVHELISDGKIPDGGQGQKQNRGIVIGSNQSSGINFGKYLQKTPKYEKDYGKIKETVLQEISQYAPPTIQQQSQTKYVNETKNTNDSNV